MSFRMVLNDHKIWTKIVEAAASVGDQVAFKVKPEGIHLRMMDPVRVMMLDMEFPAGSFEEYDCEESEIAFAIEDMMKILRRGQTGDIITLENHPAKDKKLSITFKGATKRTFTLALLGDLKLEDTPLPKAADGSNVSAKLTFEAFGIAIKDAKVPYGSDQVTITASDKDLLTIRSDGDTGDAVNEFRRGSEALLDLEFKEKAVSRYATSYLEAMLKADGLGEIASLQFSTDLPLKVTVTTPEGGRLTYFLAPRRQEE